MAPEERTAVKSKENRSTCYRYKTTVVKITKVTHVTVAIINIPFSNTIKILGVISDEKLRFRSYTSNVFTSCKYHTIIIIIIIIIITIIVTTIITSSIIISF